MHLLTKLLVLTVLCLSSAVSAFAIPTLTISSGGNGVFVVQGSGFQSAGGVDLTVRYDTTTLVNPRITKGSLASGSAIFLPNTNNRGVIYLPMVDPIGFSGSGVIVTISFDLPGSSPGVIQSLSAKVVDLNGAKIPATVQVINPAGAEPTPETAAAPSDGSAPPAAPAAPPADSAAAPAAAPTVSSRPGLATGPAPALADGSPVAPSGEPEAVKSQVAAEGAQETAPPAGGTPARGASAPGDSAPQPQERAPAENRSPSHVASKSVLEQFRTFVGQKTPQALTGIFARHTMPGIRQEPTIALTDGTTTLRLSITVQSPGKNAPNFSLNDAKLVSLKMESDSSWLIEVLPTKGSCSATITMLQSGVVTEIPLLVAPPLPSGIGSGKGDKLTETAFVKFLSEPGRDKAPGLDLNGDGKHDYVDEYIFAANYLLRKGM